MKTNRLGLISFIFLINLTDYNGGYIMINRFFLLCSIVPFLSLAAQKIPIPIIEWGLEYLFKVD